MLRLAFPGSQDVGAKYSEDNMYTIHLLFAIWLFAMSFALIIKGGWGGVPKLG